MLTEEQVKQLDGMFKFKIGDIVAPHGSSRKEAFSNWQSNRSTIRYVIHERMTQECEGGVQIQYQLAAITRYGDLSYENNWIKESLLVLSEPFSDSDPEEK